MADHVWSVLCRKGVQDKETNIISLHEVTERVTAKVPDGVGFEEEIDAGRVLFPVQLEVVSWWVRSEGPPKKIEGRLLMVAPDGEEISGLKFDIDLTGKHKSRRTIAKLPGIPANHGGGRFWFIIQSRDGDESWSTETRIPLMFEIDAAQPEGA